MFVSSVPTIIPPIALSVVESEKMTRVPGGRWVAVGLRWNEKSEGGRGHDLLRDLGWWGRLGLGFGEELMG